MPLHYRRSTFADAETVFALVTASVRRLAPEPYPQGVVDTWMSGRQVEDYRAECASGAIWVAESGGKAVGFAQGVPGEVKRLFVDAATVGLGAGAGLMERALTDARAGGVDLVRIDATLNAVSFYEKWGFREVGRGVFPGRAAPLPQIDVVLLEKRFGAEPA